MNLRSNGLVRLKLAANESIIERFLSSITLFVAYSPEYELRLCYSRCTHTTVHTFFSQAHDVRRDTSRSKYLF